MKVAIKQKLSPFFIIVLLFLFFGLVLIGDVSLIEAERNFGDKFYFLKRQIVWLGLGLIVFTFAAKVNFILWKKFALPLFLCSLIPLFLVLFPSIGELVWGARRWMKVGPISFQPSELVKFSLLLYTSSLLTKTKVGFWQLASVVILPVFLTLLEPDFATSAIMIAMIIVVWFLSGASIKGLIFSSLIFSCLGLLLIYTSPYRRQRVSGMIDPFSDPQGKSYHSYQLILTLGSGGLTGVGLGKSRQKYLYLPQVTTDSIMAVVGEEFGFIGISIVLFAFLAMIFYGFRIALASNDPFVRLFTGGFVSWLAIQGLINLSAVAVVLPLTGVPFPFVSYGGSSLVIFLLALGIVFNMYNCNTGKR